MKIPNVVTRIVLSATLLAAASCAARYQAVSNGSDLYLLDAHTGALGKAYFSDRTALTASAPRYSFSP